MVRGRRARGTRVRYPSSRRAARRTEADVAVVGAGAAGLYAALTRRPRRRPRRARLRDAARRVRQLLGPGRPRRRARRRRLAERHLRGHRARRPRRRARSAPPRPLRRGARAPCATSSRSACASTPTADGNLALGLEGGHSVRRVVHAGGSATGRRVTRQLSALVAEHDRGIEVLERRARRALRPATAAASALRLPTTGRHRCAGARRRARHRRRGRAVGAHDQPAGRDRRRAAARPRRRRRARRPRAAAVPPHRRRAADDRAPTGFLITEAIRGEGATLLDAAGERFVDELAPRDEVARAIEAGCASRATRVGRPRHARGRPGALPQRRRARCARPASTRRASWCPVAPAAHYMMGGDRGRPGRARHAAGLYAVGECACTGLHGANRLASNSLSRVLRVRPPRGRSPRSTSPRRRRARAEPAGPRPARADAADRATRARAVARRGHRAHADGPAARCSTTRTRSCARSPRCALHARREPRRAPAPRRPQRDPAARRATRVVEPTAKLRLRALGREPAGRTLAAHVHATHLTPS